MVKHYLPVAQASWAALHARHWPQCVSVFLHSMEHIQQGQDE